MLAGADLLAQSAFDPERTSGSSQNLPAAGPWIVCKPAFASKCLQPFVDSYVGATARRDTGPSNVETQCLVTDESDCSEFPEPQRMFRQRVKNRNIKRQEVFFHCA